MALFTRHSLALQASYSELKRTAQEQPLLLVGTPGTVVTHEVKGRSFLYRQFYDAQRRKIQAYIGPAASPEGEQKAAAIREAIELSQALADDGRVLGHVGYVRADARALSVLAAFANGALFAAGAVLVGSHAYGALLNELGVRASHAATEDVDVARANRLNAQILKANELGRILEGSAVELHPVPGFGKEASTSYKARGKERFRVDLLMPSREKTTRVKPVPELQAHAQALPHLGLLLASPIESVVIGKHAVVPVRVPRAEAFAWHKALVSQLRSSTLDKRTKDQSQAATLIAALFEDAPGALASEVTAWSAAERKLLRQALPPVVDRLKRGGHDEAAEHARAVAG